ncbi:MAG TPA: AMP-binding protein [Gemmataceae bacterium]|nr:AMP-binding protein [Gemmataceae bacterium]
MTFTATDLIDLGLTADEARNLLPRLESVWNAGAPETTWHTISQTILTPRHPFVLHQFLFQKAYENWDRGSQGPPPAWSPTTDSIRKTNIAQFVAEHGISDYSWLHAWSVNNRAEFWGTFVRNVGIRFARPFIQVCDSSARTRAPRWFVGGELNIVESCFTSPADQFAVLHQLEGGSLSCLTRGELRALVNRVSNGLVRAGLQPGDAIAIDMPMNAAAVAIYLGIVQAGCVVVSIADSLAPEEVAVRLKLADTKAIFTQDVLRRGGKELPLYEKVLAAELPRAIVLPAGESLAARLRDGDLEWDAFLSPDDRFTPLPRDPDGLTNILFSSGTTGEPKAIPWTQTTPIKCVADAWFHHDVQPGERIAWPTNLGWMMGPWLIYASLINRAAMAIYDGAPTGRPFGQFICDSEVSLLGVIPSLVKTWRTAACMEGLDWSRIRRFSSTGECSNPDDMLYLMHLAGYKPIIEYCGGTEVGGGYVAATMVQPNAPSTFTTPCMGIDFVILDEAGQPAHQGETFLVPPSIGLSARLLKRDHDAVYYADTPKGPRGEGLRRHGDYIERLPGGYFRAHGRADDTMNLGGIKVSSAEIERVLNAVLGVVETAAVAVPPPGGGPSLLWIFAVPQEANADHAALLAAFRQALREHLNPLFKIDNLMLVEALPRTASNKVVRRLLRDRAVKARPSGLRS